jgi:hypothetical protein
MELAPTAEIVPSTSPSDLELLEANAWEVVVNKRAKATNITVMECKSFLDIFYLLYIFVADQVKKLLSEKYSNFILTF